MVSTTTLGTEVFYAKYYGLHKAWPLQVSIPVAMIFNWKLIAKSTVYYLWPRRDVLLEANFEAFPVATTVQHRVSLLGSIMNVGAKHSAGFRSRS